MLAAVRVDLAPPTDDPARVKALTQQILAQKQFQPPRRSLLQAAWHWLATEVGKLLSHLFGGGSFGSSWSGVVVVVVVGVAVVALGYLIATHARRSRRRRGGPVVVVRDEGPSRTAAAWRAEAAAHEAARRWRDALRCRYRALLAELAGRGLLAEIPGRTSGEYRRDVASVVPAAASAFDGATDLFEQAWYGDRPTGREEQAAFDALARRVLVPVGAAGDTWDVSPRDTSARR